MEHLSETLRAAAADPPPTGIDLDRLIAGERRRRRVTTGAAGLVVLAVAGVAALTLRAPAGHGVGGLPSASTGTLGDCVAVLPRPSATARGETAKPTATTTATPRMPTEPEHSAVVRLSAALDARLPAVMPGFTFTDVVHPTCEGIQFEPDVYPARYYANLQARDGAGIGTVVVMVHYVQFVDMSAYQHHETRPDGTIVGWMADTVVPEMGGLHGAQVSVLRPDGTFLTLLSQNIVDAKSDTFTRRTAPATVEQLIAIGTDPGLTLYP
jgi:hypothetical protein